MSIQQMLLGVGAVATKTYVDDVFSTYLYTGNQTAGHTITNGIDLAGKGGLVWIKGRESAYQHELVDTVRGAGYVLKSDSTGAQGSSTSSELDQFNSDGFRLAYRSAGGNSNNQDYASWSFRKAPGFFDVVTYSGDGTDNRSISHSLGCSVGMMIIKVTNHADDWLVWHKDLEDEKALTLNTNNEAFGYSSSIPSDPTSSSFTVSSNVKANASGKTYVCYLFAGGESTAATACSVSFDGSNDKVSIPDSTDFEFGSGDFTVEAWVKQSNTAGAGADSHTIVNKWDNTSNAKEWILRIDNGTGSNKLQWLQTTDGNSNQITTGDTVIHVGQWYHVAVVGHSGTIKLFVNGIQQASTATQGTINSYSNPLIFGYNESSNGQWMDGSISNCRIVKGTAVYTSSFKPPTEPLTNITNTKLLCLNNSSVTGSTVSPGTLTNDGATASTDSPFNDPAGFKFGDAGDQNVIKCGSFVASTDYDVWNNRVIELGWEPSFVMYKNASNTGNWEIFDTMRGFLATSDDSAMLEANTSDAEEAAQRITIEPTGFKERGVITTGDTVIYVAIRRPDGYVGKPPELGTSVFNMVMGTSNSDIPTFVSGFVTDFAFNRQPASSENWWTQSRITGDKYLVANNTDAESTSSPNEWDFMNGWYSSTSDFSNQQSWMWKRHAGFDVVTYNGDGVNGRGIAHSMNDVPEMMIVKRRSSTEDWTVYHTGLTSVNYHLTLNGNGAEVDMSGSPEKVWKSAPTATHFEIGSHDRVNTDGETYLALLFSSIDGISKVGSYTGNGSTTGPTITTGFSPRFLIIKGGNVTGSWFVYDTTRGFGSGNDQRLLLESSAAQYGSSDRVDPSSTGFQIQTDWDQFNENGKTYIYYAHA